MKFSSFFIQLILTSLICVAGYFGLQSLMSSIDYLDLTLIGILMFALISIGIFLMSKRAVKTADKNFFIYVIVINIFIKVIASFIIMALFVKMTNPPDKLYLIPFLMIYLVFTIFETYFLNIQAREK